MGGTSVLQIANTYCTGYQHDSFAAYAAYWHNNCAEEWCNQHYRRTDNLSQMSIPIQIILIIQV